MATSGSGRTATPLQYTTGGKDSAPRWSPDGTRLAFLWAREDRAQIYLLSSAGGEARRLTERKLGTGTPVWSPDGRSIAFTAPVAFPDEPEEEQEGEKKRAKTHVIDRARFKFNGAGLIDDRRTHLFTIDVASGDCTQLTSGDWNVRSPAGRPIRSTWPSTEIATPIGTCAPSLISGSCHGRAGCAA